MRSSEQIHRQGHPVPPLPVIHDLTNLTQRVGSQQCAHPLALTEDPALIVMLVSGPPTHRLFHVNPSPELVVQLKGNARFDLIVADKLHSINLESGEAAVLPAHVPHRPVRHAGTVGLVCEVNRAKGAPEWFEDRCDSCLQVRATWPTEDAIVAKPGADPHTKRGTCCCATEEQT